jgi:hypothetical protein
MIFWDKIMIFVAHHDPQTPEKTSVFPGAEPEKT